MKTTAEHLLRELAPQVLGAVVRRYGDFGAAEDAVQEALTAAALEWPATGVPENPLAWLIHVAARKLRRGFRHAARGGARGEPRRGPPRPLSRLQRGLRSKLRRGFSARRSLERSDPSRARRPRTPSRKRRGRRASGTHAPDGRAAP